MTSAVSPSTSALEWRRPASGGDVVVSSTVRDLVVGSGIEFDDRGRHALKGVPDDGGCSRSTSRSA